jgi:hypothetical protein
MGSEHFGRLRTTTFFSQCLTNHYSTGTSREEAQKGSLPFNFLSLSGRFPWVYRKKPKISHIPDKSRGEETQSTIVVEGEHSPLFLRIQQMMSSSSSKKQIDTTLITQPPQGSTGISIFEKYNLIKKKNEMLTNNTYAQFWKQTSTTQA